MAILSCKNVSMGYEGVPVLTGVDFEISRGDYLCIVGINGAGKSTLIKGLLGLRSPLSGTISIGEDLLPNQIGYLPQQTSIQRDFPASILEVVLSGRLNRLGRRPFYTAKDRADAMEKLRMVGLESQSRRCYQELSGGQQQRVLLARALCATGAMLLLDEPAAGLDPMMSHELYDIIDHINRQHGITIVMVSHDLQATLHYATHILHLEHRQLFFGTRAEYLQSEAGRRFTGEDCHD